MPSQPLRLYQGEHADTKETELRNCVKVEMAVLGSRR